MRTIPMIVVPGIGADGRLWQPVVDKLTDVIEPIHAVFTSDSIAGMAEEILASAPDRFYVAGTSFGSYVAIDIALREDPRLAGLIVVNGSARAANPPQLERGNGMLDEARSGHYDDLVPKLAAGVAAGNADLEKFVAAMAYDVGAEAFILQQAAALGRRDRREELAQVSVPTLILSADNDHLTPPSLNNEIARLVPGAELHILPGVGHLSVVEAAADVAQIIRDWLGARDDLGPATATA
jgi:pimeloyl-ACP methyl ester carboxylesterase